jgi:hypothetical protein
MDINSFIYKLEKQFPTDYKNLVLPERDSTKFKIILRRTFERPLIITPDENEYQKSMNAKQRYRRRWYLENRANLKTIRHTIK